MTGTRSRSTVDGGAESSRHSLQGTRGKERKTVRREFVLPWRALCAAFESHLYRRDSSQGCPPSGSARSDRGSRAVGEHAAVAAQSGGSGPVANEIGRQSAHG